MFYKVLITTLLVISCPFGSLLAVEIDGITIDAHVLEEASSLVNNCQENAKNNPYLQGTEKSELSALKPVEYKPAPSSEPASLANMQGVNLEEMLRRYQKPMAEAKNKTKRLNKLMVFISLSMPKQSLKDLSEQVNRAGGVLVLRGVVKNSITETAKELQKLSDKGVSAVIDPNLFKVFDVQQVPTFVVVPYTTYPCSQRDCNFTPQHDRLSGNVTLNYALELISEKGEFTSEVADSYLNKLRGSNL